MGSRLCNGDEHPNNAPHGVWNTLLTYFTLSSVYLYTIWLFNQPRCHANLAYCS